MSAIIHPTIPAGTYPTNDTLITVTVDTLEIFNASTQEEVNFKVKFTDNRQNDPLGPDPGTTHQTNLIKNNFVTWVGAVKDSEHPDRKFDKVMIYEVTPNAAFTRSPAASGSARTHVDGRAAGNQVSPIEYSVKFWVWNDQMKQGESFQIDPKLGVNP